MGKEKGSTTTFSLDFKKSKQIDIECLDLIPVFRKMTTADEKLCLQWNDFKDNVSSAFGDLRQDKEFTDVTLVCEDGQQVEAHKVVLVASSPFFLNILKRNKHPHPLIYMRGGCEARKPDGHRGLLLSWKGK